MLFRTYCKGLNRAPAAPVLYENFYVGPCRSLIFGVGLGLYDFARGEGSDHGRPPTIVEKCINAVDDRGEQAGNHGGSRLRAQVWRPRGFTGSAGGRRQSSW